MSDVRKYTIKLLEEMDDGLWSSSKLAESLLGWMSEDEVKAFYKYTSYKDVSHEDYKSIRELVCEDDND